MQVKPVHVRACQSSRLGISAALSPGGHAVTLGSPAALNAAVFVWKRVSQ